MTGVQTCALPISEPGNLLALRLDGAGEEIGHPNDDDDFYIMFNGTTRARNFRLPAAAGGGPWRRVIDTYFEAPNDVLSPEEVAPLLDQKSYTVRSRSVVVLTAARARGG